MLIRCASASFSRLAAHVGDRVVVSDYLTVVNTDMLLKAIIFHQLAV